MQSISEWNLVGTDPTHYTPEQLTFKCEDSFAVALLTSSSWFWGHFRDSKISKVDSAIYLVHDSSFIFIIKHDETVEKDLRFSFQHFLLGPV
jgi:hypothetical protein